MPVTELADWLRGGNPGPVDGRLMVAQGRLLDELALSMAPGSAADRWTGAMRVGLDLVPLVRAELLDSRAGRLTLTMADLRMVLDAGRLGWQPAQVWQPGAEPTGRLRGVAQLDDDEVDDLREQVGSLARERDGLIAQLADFDRMTRQVPSVKVLRARPSRTVSMMADSLARDLADVADVLKDDARCRLTIVRSEGSDLTVGDVRQVIGQFTDGHGGIPLGIEPAPLADWATLNRLQGEVAAMTRLADANEAQAFQLRHDVGAARDRIAELESQAGANAQVIEESGQRIASLEAQLAERPDWAGVVGAPGLAALVEQLRSAVARVDVGNDAEVRVLVAPGSDRMDPLSKGQLLALVAHPNGALADPVKRPAEQAAEWTELQARYDAQEVRIGTALARLRTIVAESEDREGWVGANEVAVEVGAILRGDELDTDGEEVPWCEEPVAAEPVPDTKPVDRIAIAELIAALQPFALLEGPDAGAVPYCDNRSRPGGHAESLAYFAAVVAGLPTVGEPPIRARRDKPRYLLPSDFLLTRYLDAEDHERKPSLGGTIDGTGYWVVDDLGWDDNPLSTENFGKRPALRDGKGHCWASWINLPHLADLREQLDAGAKALADQRAKTPAFSLMENPPERVRLMSQLDLLEAIAADEYGAADERARRDARPLVMANRRHDSAWCADKSTGHLLESLQSDLDPYLDSLVSSAVLAELRARLADPMAAAQRDDIVAPDGDEVHADDGELLDPRGPFVVGSFDGNGSWVRMAGPFASEGQALATRRTMAPQFEDIKLLVKPLAETLDVPAPPSPDESDVPPMEPAPTAEPYPFIEGGDDDPLVIEMRAMSATELTRAARQGSPWAQAEVARRKAEAPVHVRREGDWARHLTNGEVLEALVADLEGVMPVRFSSDSLHVLRTRLAVAPFEPTMEHLARVVVATWHTGDNDTMDDGDMNAAIVALEAALAGTTTEAEPIDGWYRPGSFPDWLVMHPEYKPTTAQFRWAEALDAALAGPPHGRGAGRTWLSARFVEWLLTIDPYVQYRIEREFKPIGTPRPRGGVAPTTDSYSGVIAGELREFHQQLAGRLKVDPTELNYVLVVTSREYIDKPGWSPAIAQWTRFDVTDKCTKLEGNVEVVHADDGPRDDFRLDAGAVRVEGMSVTLTGFAPANDRTRDQLSVQVILDYQPPADPAPPLKTLHLTGKLCGDDEWLPGGVHAPPTTTGKLLDWGLRGVTKGLEGAAWLVERVAR